VRVELFQDRFQNTLAPENAASCVCTRTLASAALSRGLEAQEDAVPTNFRVSAKSGPPGALLRWLLADLNFAAPDAAAWFPFGTFAANLLACAVIFAMEVRALPHYLPSDTPVQHARAKRLSTVSRRHECSLEGRPISIRSYLVAFTINAP
jgi:hypothetical protein